jgi:hypothetical protein
MSTSQAIDGPGTKGKDREQVGIWYVWSRDEEQEGASISLQEGGAVSSTNLFQANLESTLKCTLVTKAPSKPKGKKIQVAS